MSAWHFVAESGLLRGGHPMILGEKLIHTGPLKLCKSGYHASTRALDAIHYAPGPIVCRVECGGEIIKDTDKIVARERTVVWSYDATAVLRFYACSTALDLCDRAGVDLPPIVRGYLETQDESIRDAARAVVWDAARDEAWAVARDAQNGLLESLLFAAAQDHGIDVEGGR